MVNLSKVNVKVAGTHGFRGAFDGRYVYLIGSSPLARYDTQGSITATSSRSTFDPTALDTSLSLFTGGGGFDGRYVYFVGALLARYDTQSDFTNGSAWSVFDTSKIKAGATGYNGAAFDGRYLYLLPMQGTIAARFDAKSPSSMPSLPAFFGSF